MDNTLRVGSLFSGIGGFDLGLERAGFDVIWQVENNEYCRKVLKKHWSSVPCHYDVRSIDWEFIPAVDLVCAGFPCQPFSTAGKRRVHEDDRFLWPEVVRCLETLWPTWFVGENVFGLLDMGIEQVHADLETLGYQVTTLGIPACALDAPHVRKRLWILAYRDGIDAQARRERCGGIRAEKPGRWAPDLSCRCREAQNETPKRCSHWELEPGMGRVAPRVSNRVDRLRGLGNAIVPQIAEVIG